MPGPQIHTADLKLPGGGMLELLQYVGPVPTVLAQRRMRRGTAMSRFASRMSMPRAARLGAGALDCSAPGALDEPGSSWDQARVCYARDPDGRTIEFVERSPPTAPR
jgi:hypothetical protein